MICFKLLLIHLQCVPLPSSIRAEWGAQLIVRSNVGRVKAWGMCEVRLCTGLRGHQGACSIVPVPQAQPVVTLDDKVSVITSVWCQSATLTAETKSSFLVLSRLWLLSPLEGPQYHQTPNHWAKRQWSDSWNPTDSLEIEKIDYWPNTMFNLLCAKLLILWL